MAIWIPSGVGRMTRLLSRPNRWPDLIDLFFPPFFSFAYDVHKFVSLTVNVQTCASLRKGQSSSYLDPHFSPLVLSWWDLLRPRTRLLDLHTLKREKTEATGQGERERDSQFRLSLCVFFPWVHHQFTLGMRCRLREYTQLWRTQGDGREGKGRRDQHTT